MTWFLPLFALVSSAGQVPAAAPPRQLASAQHLLAALPPLEGARLSNYQGQLFNATQLRLQIANPRRYVDIDRILLKHNMCFREVARSTVPERFAAVLEMLSAAERQEVLDHLALPGADRWFLFAEGSLPRLELPFPWVAPLEADLPGVRRFYNLVGSRMRLRDRTDIAITSVPCHRQIKQELDEAGLTMPSATPQPSLGR